MAMDFKKGVCVEVLFPVIGLNDSNFAIREKFTGIVEEDDDKKIVLKNAIYKVQGEGYGPQIEKIRLITIYKSKIAGIIPQ